MRPTRVTSGAVRYDLAVTKKRTEPADFGAFDARAHIAALETTNAHLAARIAELSFLSSTAARLGSTLDQRVIANVVIDAVGTATASKGKQRFLMLRTGNALVYCAGMHVDPRVAEEFVRMHRDAIDRCMRTGAIAAAGSHAIVPIPGEANEPGCGCIVVAEDAQDLLGSAERRRLTKLAELTGRSLANARLLARSIAAGVTDELTGVYNRRYFDRRLAEELKRARRLGERMALILLDLDFFKAVNDRYGHQEGDRALCAVAQAIVAAVRDIDVVTRWGGEEFTIVIPGTDGHHAVIVAERVRAAIAGLRLQSAAGETFGITASCGVAWAAAHLHTPAQCVAAADRCLLEAKRAGRNRTVSMELDGGPAHQGRSPEILEAKTREHRGSSRDA
jgi:diguanylate cyclase (GGDEF)-like protein